MHCVVKDLSLGWHEETWISADLAKFGISHLGLDDGVYERESEGVFLHLHGVEVIESKFGYTCDADGELATEVSLFSLEVNGFVNLLGRKNIVSYSDVVDEDTFQLVSLRAQNFILLEGLKVVHGEVADDRLVAGTVGVFLGLLESELGHGSDGFLSGCFRV